MTRTKRISRRVFLAAGGAGAAGLALAGLRFYRDQRVLEQLAGAASQLSGNPGAAAMGRACQRAMAFPASVGGLAEDLFRDWRPDKVPPSRDVLVSFLRGRMAEDFAAGRTVEVAGWVLSRTEARLFALVERLMAEA